MILVLSNMTLYFCIFCSFNISPLTFGPSYRFCLFYSLGVYQYCLFFWESALGLIDFCSVLLIYNLFISILICYFLPWSDFKFYLSTVFLALNLCYLILGVVWCKAILLLTYFWMQLYSVQCIQITNFSILICFREYFYPLFYFHIINIYSMSWYLVSK